MPAHAHTREHTCTVRPTECTRAHTNKHARTRTHALHPTARIDGWPGAWARTHMHTIYPSKNAQTHRPPRLGPSGYHPHALRPPRPSLTATSDIVAPVHVELAPRRREAMTSPAQGRGAAEGGGEVCPVPGGRIVHVEVVEVACAGRGRGARRRRVGYKQSGLRACGRLHRSTRTLGERCLGERWQGMRWGYWGMLMIC
jgi:hypothetical protein